MGKEENKVTKEVFDYLSIKALRHPIYFWRSGNHSVYDPNKKIYRRTGAHTPKGVPDISCVINGKFIGIEIKTPAIKSPKGGVIKPQTNLRPEQKTFRAKLEGAGGVYVTARSAEDIDKVLKTFLR